MTEPELLLWRLLRDRRFDGFKFRRQVPIGNYVADFANFESRLIVELDGGQHSETERDRIRDAELRRRGFRVLRFWNNQLLRERSAVME